MAYKSFVSVLTDETLTQPVLTFAIEMARSYDAHLDVLCLGVDRSQAGYYYAGASALLLEQTISRAQEEADAIKMAGHRILKGCDVLWGCDSDVAQLADLARHVSARARFSDIAILPQPYGENRGAELEPATEACLFEGRTPALIVPDVHNGYTQPDRIMIAWDESNEALKAIRAALPMLKNASDVHVAIVDPPVHSPNRSDPGGALSQYLARHGVKIEIDVLSKTLPNVSDVLLRHATDTRADLIVMGAYGHSRFREAVFGGATRNMLEHAKLPILMAH